jgi:hypothetical protein
MNLFSFHKCKGRKRECSDCNTQICSKCMVKTESEITCKLCAASKGGAFAKQERMKLQGAAVGAGVAGLGALGMFASCST